MLKQIWNRCKSYVMSSMGFWTAFFIIVWFFGWYFNAAHGTHYDLQGVKDMYVWVLAQLNITHGVNSIFNSPKGAMPNVNSTPQP